MAPRKILFTSMRKQRTIEDVRWLTRAVKHGFLAFLAVWLTMKGNVIGTHEKPLRDYTREVESA